MRFIRPGAHEDSVRLALARFALLALASAVAIGGVGVWLFQDLGTNEAVRDAKELTRITGEGIVEPELTDGLVRGDARSIERVDRVVRERVLSDSLVRVKIWTRDGKVVYSDEPRLIGARYELDADDIESLNTGGVIAGVLEPDPSQEENRFELDFGKLLEVYLPISTPSGERLLFETYIRYSSVDQVASRNWREFAPALLGGLLLYALIQLPFAWLLARRVRRARQQRERLLRRAIEASEIERRRIAHDLHDGVVQNLAGVSYALAATAESAPAGIAPTLQEAVGETRQAVRELRTLLVEIYPPELQREGLRSALQDLLAPCAEKGMETTLEISEESRLPYEVEAFFFRVAQEAVRNVVRHAQAKRISIEVGRAGADATLVVSDDGRGFDPDDAPEGKHFGLRLLRDLAADAGGALDVESERGGGTRVSAVMPLEAAADSPTIPAYSGSAREREAQPTRETRDALRHVVDAHELERRRLARELHDETGQALTSILLGLKTAEETEDASERRRALAEVRGLVGETLQDVRRLAVELRPKALDDFGLEPALERLADSFRERTGISVELESRLNERLPPDVETLLYRLAQEALSNVIKHAQATNVSIVLSRRNGCVTALIEDDGRGFPPESEQNGSGLKGIRERLALVDGELRIESKPGGGATLVAEVPA